VTFAIRVPPVEVDAVPPLSGQAFEAASTVSRSIVKKVITIGEILVEIMATEVGDGFLEPIPLIGPFPSGAPAIFIDQAAKLGQPCGLIGCVGDDDFGRLNVERLRRDGADVSAIAVDPDRPTGSAFVRYRADGARDFVYNIRHSASGAIAPTAASDALIESADHLHVMGSALSSPALAAMIRDALRRIRARGGTVSFDPNLRKEILAAPGMRDALEAVLAQTDLFLPSGEEIFLLSDATDPDAAAHELLVIGISPGARLWSSRTPRGRLRSGRGGRCRGPPPGPSSTPS
jgi:sugar/nucleoside kinase (ribokinase family)